MYVQSGGEDLVPLCEPGIKCYLLIPSLLGRLARALSHASSSTSRVKLAAAHVQVRLVDIHMTFWQP